MIVAIVAIAHLHHHRSKFAVAQERAGVFGTNYLFFILKDDVQMLQLHHRSKFAVAQERAGVFGTNYLPRDLSHHFTGGPLLLVQLSDPTLPTNTKYIYIENTNTNKIAESLLILGQWH